MYPVEGLLNNQFRTLPSLYINSFFRLHQTLPELEERRRLTRSTLHSALSFSIKGRNFPETTRKTINARAALTCGQGILVCPPPGLLADSCSQDGTWEDDLYDRHYERRYPRIPFGSRVSLFTRNSLGTHRWGVTGVSPEVFEFDGSHLSSLEGNELRRSTLARIPTVGSTLVERWIASLSRPPTVVPLVQLTSINSVSSV